MRVRSREAWLLATAEATRPVSEPIRITRDLLTVLLERAADAEPQSVTISLATSPATELEWESDPREMEGPVFSHFYMPEAGRSTGAVFGVDLAVSPGRTQGRFVSHPDGDPSVSVTDDLHAVVFVAVPPWTDADVVPYDRSGRQHSLEILEAAPPDESVP
jgi:proteasome lid subunit RPN8/RPN11